MKKIFFVLVMLSLPLFAGVSFAKDIPASTAQPASPSLGGRGEPKITNLEFTLITDNTGAQLMAELSYGDVVTDIKDARLTLVILVYLTASKEQFHEIWVGRFVKELIEEGSITVEKESASSGKIRLGIFIPRSENINEKNYITGAGMAIADLPGRLSLPSFVVF
jgi:hypothetical protein